MKVTREWAMPSSDTFSIPPIARLLDRVIFPGAVVVDPFARNSRRGTVTNDLNPATSAKHHLDAVDFCDWLVSTDFACDVVLFDPPYSPRQISELYQSIGRACSGEDTQNARLYAAVKRSLSIILRPGGLAISFGWNSGGFGDGYELTELLLVPHGGAHNDTIVTVERKIQGSLFQAAAKDSAARSVNEG